MDEQQKHRQPRQGSEQRGNHGDHEDEGTQTSPRRSEQQDSPEPERLVTPAEEAGQDIPSLEEPPQAEGPREDG